MSGHNSFHRQPAEKNYTPRQLLKTPYHWKAEDLATLRFFANGTFPCTNVGKLSLVFKD